MQNMVHVGPGANALTTSPRYVVQQRKEWGEILSGWETKNRYDIQDANGHTVLHAGEVGGSFWTRGFLKAKRPFTIELRDPAGHTAMVMERPWRWFFSYAEVLDGQKRKVGAIQQRWAWFRRRFEIQDANGKVIGEIFGPLLRPWTFQILREGRECGMIQKKWSGMMKEAFTDSDTFAVELGPQLDEQARMICLGATFLIDFCYFENQE